MPGGLEPRSCRGGELSFALADQAELGAAAVRSLEMKADDLVLAFFFRTKPFGQALVQICPHFLRHTLVCRLLDQHVGEPERVLDG